MLHVSVIERRCDEVQAVDVSEFVPRDVERAAHALGLDVATAEVTQMLESRGVPCVLLKGPATARWLYADDPDGRSYLDVDLGVDPEQFEAAERLLVELGFVNPYATFRVSAMTHESVWERPGSPPVTVDLHRGFHGVGDWSAWWSAMDAHTTALEVAGRRVRIPDAAGCALIVALHDTTIDRAQQSMTDLRRAFAIFGDDVWREAAHRADLCDAVPSFFLGLSLHEDGLKLVDRLGLPTDLPADVAIRSLVAAGVDVDKVGRAWSLQRRMTEADGLRPRMRALRQIAFPSAEFLRATRPLARRGWWGLMAVRLTRPLALIVRTPGIFVLVLRGRRRSRRGRNQP